MSQPPPEPDESSEQERARILAELERSLAEGLPADPDAGWLYPPAPHRDASPEPSPSPKAWALLAAVLTVVAVAVVAAVAEGRGG
jgi:hypothetical protein